MGILDLFYPKYCVGCRKIGSYICSNCFASISFVDELICVVCNRQAIGGTTHPKCKGRYMLDGVVASLTYKGVVRKLVYTFKYRPYVTHLRKTLGDLFYEGLLEQEAFLKTVTKDSVLIPIPLHPEKQRKRGYNHAALLAEELGRRLSLPVLDGLLRVKKTESQFKLSKEERQQNITKAFKIAESKKPVMVGKNIILVDDLYTSGTTLSEAAHVLKRSGVKSVWGATFAHGK